MIKDVKVLLEVMLTNEELADFWTDKGIVISKENTINITTYTLNDKNSLSNFINELKVNTTIDNRIGVNYVIERLEQIEHENNN